MAKVFVSHASEDLGFADRVHGWLVDAGHQVFLDRDLRDGIDVGDDWEQRLYERLRWADSVVCVVTRAYLTSQWCTAEVAIARSRGSRLLPILTEPGLTHPLLQPFQYADATGKASTARMRLVEALARVDQTSGLGWPDDRSPFPGLRPFDIDEHLAFFGRGDEVEQLAAVLRSPAARVDASVLLVVGPSGCGKSSLIRAGLIPMMAAEPDWWTVPAFVPGADPVAGMARALADAAQHAGLRWSVGKVRNRLGTEGLRSLADELLVATRCRRLLVVVDQVEELLNLTPSGERARFAELLREALTPGSVQVVATLRPEFLDQVLLSRELAILPTRTHTLRPLRRDALRAVIEGPADLAGIAVDSDLVTRLIADTDSGEALPLLAYALAELAAGVTRGGALLTSRYEQIGGVQGALIRQADAALAEAVSVGGRTREEVIAELLRLATVDEQGRPTRVRVHADELPERTMAELDTFVARRLLITDVADDAQVVLESRTKPSCRPGHHSPTPSQPRRQHCGPDVPSNWPPPTGMRDTARTTDSGRVTRLLGPLPTQEPGSNEPDNQPSRPPTTRRGDLGPHGFDAIENSSLIESGSASRQGSFCKRVFTGIAANGDGRSRSSPSYWSSR